MLAMAQGMSLEEVAKLDSAFWRNDDCRMAYLKVLPCSISDAHDWRACPFYHPGERGRRRSFERHVYRSELCPDIRQGGRCPRGDGCSFAHNVYESWLHPDMFKTKMCSDGADCKRKICFFAHSAQDLRTPVNRPPEAQAGASDAGDAAAAPADGAAAPEGKQGDDAAGCEPQKVPQPQEPPLPQSRPKRQPAAAQPRRQGPRAVPLQWQQAQGLAALADSFGPLAPQQQAQQQQAQQQQPHELLLPWAQQQQQQQHQQLLAQQEDSILPVWSQLQPQQQQRHPALYQPAASSPQAAAVTAAQQQQLRFLSQPLPQLRADALSQPLPHLSQPLPHLSQPLPQVHMLSQPLSQPLPQLPDACPPHAGAAAFSSQLPPRSLLYGRSVSDGGAVGAGDFGASPGDDFGVTSSDNGLLFSLMSLQDAPAAAAAEAAAARAAAARSRAAALRGAAAAAAGLAGARGAAPPAAPPARCMGASEPLYAFTLPASFDSSYMTGGLSEPANCYSQPLSAPLPPLSTPAGAQLQAPGGAPGGGGAVGAMGAAGGAPLMYLLDSGAFAEPAPQGVGTGGGAPPVWVYTLGPM